MISKTYLYGGGAIVAVLAGYLILTHKSSAAPADTSGLGGYSSPIVYSGAASAADPGGLNASTAYSTDNSVGQMIAGQLAVAQLNSNVSLAQIASDKETALAGFANDLAITKDKSQAAIEQSLASQLGNIVSSFVTTKSKSGSSSGFLGIGGGSSAKSSTQGINNLIGTIGFSNGVIALDLKHSEPVVK